MDMLSLDKIENIVQTSLDSLALEGKRVLVIIPDGTRTFPADMFFRLICKSLRGRLKGLDYLIALGTHPPLNEDALLRHVGITPQEKATAYSAINLFNHRWDDPQSLTLIGTIPADETEILSNGLLSQPIPVRLNRRILEYDHLLVCGPVFPHEIAGFSGGNKYFFPGIAGADIIHFTHWLGALLTSYVVIGTKDTLTRRMIDRAASFIPRPKHALCSVVSSDGLAGLFFGSPEQAFSAAADCSAQVHIRWQDQAYQKVLSVLPEMYYELWVGSKGLFKVEPVVADGGEVILYAPHIRQISQTHGAMIQQVGYHVRDYFVKQWDKYRQYPWATLAHCTFLRGIGEYDASTGTELPRIQVTLATGIPEEICQSVNLGYRNPAEIDPQVWMAHQEPGTLVVPRAGEYLYRLRQT